MSIKSLNIFCTFPGMFLVALAVLVARNYGGIMYPAAAYEDGLLFLGHFHENSGVDAIWNRYRGYVATGPSILGFAISKLPLVFQPILYVFVSLVLWALVLSMLMWGQIEIPGLERRHRALLILTLLVAPLGNALVFQLLSYSLWTMLLFLVLTVLYYRPSNALSLVTIGTLGSIAAFSHPGSLFLLPILALRYVKTQHTSSRIFYAWIVVAILAYAAVGIDFGVDPSREPPKLSSFFFLVAERVIFETLASTGIRVWLLESGFGFVLVFIAAIVVLELWPLWRSSIENQRRAVSRSVVLILLLSLFGTLSGVDLVSATNDQRYTLIPSVLFILTLFVLLVPHLECDRQTVLRRVFIRAWPLWAVIVVILQGEAYFTFPDHAFWLSVLIDEANKAESLATPYCLTYDRDIFSIFLSSDGFDGDCHDVRSKL